MQFGVTASLLFLILLLPWPSRADAPPIVVGTVRDETGGALPGVDVRLQSAAGALHAVTDADGRYRFANAARGPADVRFSLANFAPVTRAIVIADTGARVDVVLHLALSADVTVTGERTFTNIADADDPARSVVGIAQSASQGAITARQLDVRPILRPGEVLETVPGLVISQHSGEGKANQYYLRGFNLDHGTDFATTVAGMPVNMPTHAHGHGYSDVNFLIPELVSGIQFSKGPYFADQGDFATAGAATINYANVLERPMARLEGGADAYGRAMFAASPRLGAGHALAALEVSHNDGPWTRPDGYRRVNALLRYTRGDRVNGWSLTGMGYRARWHSTDQVPQRAVDDGRIGRFDTLDPTAGGETSRYSASLEWQRAGRGTATRASAYAIAYGLDLFSNFTLFLDDPVNGDQLHQADRRVVAGGRLANRWTTWWGGRAVQNTAGIQLRNDDIGRLGLHRTRARARLSTVRDDSVVQTSAAAYAQNELQWTPWLRTLAGLRADGYRFDVDGADPANAGLAYAGLLSPKATLVVGPWRGSELYANGGFGYHSNDARGATITRDPSTLAPVDRVTPLARARGGELGFRSVAIPRLQTSVALWTLALDSELVFVGDAGTTTAGRPSRRTGIEWSSYYSPRPWLIVDGDLAWSRARFTDGGTGDRIPGAVSVVAAGGVTVNAVRRTSGSLRLRYFGPRPLIEDDSVRSSGTTMLNADLGYRLSEKLRLAVGVFNLLDARASDIDYFYTSRLPGEPEAGVDDVHFHPVPRRTARVSLVVDF